MNCLPVGKLFGRILSKMFPASNKLSPSLQRLTSFDDDKENLEENKSIDFDSSYFSASSSTMSGWMSPPRMNHNRDYMVFNPNCYFKVYDDFENTSPSNSSGYESSESKPPDFRPDFVADKIKVLQDELNTSLDSIMCSIKDISQDTLEDEKSTLPYSRLSNFYSTKTLDSQIFHHCNDITASLLHEDQKYHDELRREFEMNGKTTEVTNHEQGFAFSPVISSTPMVTRKFNEPQPKEKELLPPRQCPTYGYSRNRRMLKKKIKPNKKSLEDHCVFCKNNGAPEATYRSHTVKDSQGRVSCPTLRRYKCPICGEDGDRSHTVKYCPMKPIITMDDCQRMDRQI